MSMPVIFLKIWQADQLSARFTLTTAIFPYPAFLRRRSLSTNPENRCPERLLVAQKAEFRYIGLEKWDYQGRISITRPEKGSKMIANRRFPAGDQCPEWAAYCGTWKNTLFPIISRSVIFDEPPLQEKNPFFPKAWLLFGKDG
jgi:hypothetical protein